MECFVGRALDLAWGLEQFPRDSESWLDCHHLDATELVKKLAAEKNASCATHNPYLVDEFAADDVYVCAEAADGRIYMARLSDHPDWPRVHGGLRPGEFWSHVGEGWVLESPRKSVIT